MPASAPKLSHTTCVSTSPNTEHKPCYLLVPPTELRSEIYKAVFGMPDISQDLSRTPTRAEDEIHSTHDSCRRLWDEKPNLIIHSDGENHDGLGDFETFVGLPSMRLSPLLQTCRKIKREGLEEFHRAVEMRIVELHGLPKEDQPRIDYFWRTYSGACPQQLFSRMTLTIEIEEAGWEGGDCCPYCALNEGKAVWRFPPLVRYLLTQVKHVDINVSLKRWQSA